MKISSSVAYGMMGVAAIMWATSGSLTVLAIDGGASAVQVSVFATVFTALILLPLIYALDRKSIKIEKRDFWPFLAFSLVTGTFFAIAWYVCVDRVGVATAVILLYLYPSIVTIASVFLLGEKLTPQKMVALPLTFIGCVLVAGAQDLGEGIPIDIIGIALGLYTAFSGAVYYLWGKKFLDKYSANTVILYMTILSIPGLILIANPANLGTDGITSGSWVYILAIGFFPGTVGFVLSMAALNYIEASKASIVASIEPVAAVLIAAAVLSDTLNRLQTVGVALVFLGVILLRVSLRRRNGAKQATDKTRPDSLVLK